MSRYRERGRPRRIGSRCYDAGRLHVYGELVSVTAYFAIVAANGIRHKVPIERLRSGSPVTLSNLEKTT